MNWVNLDESESSEQEYIDNIIESLDQYAGFNLNFGKITDDEETSFMKHISNSQGKSLISHSNSHQNLI
jgi:uncharacterized protein with NRDE domain